MPQNSQSTGPSGEYQIWARNQKPSYSVGELFCINRYRFLSLPHLKSRWQGTLQATSIRASSQDRAARPPRTPRLTCPRRTQTRSPAPTTVATPTARTTRTPPTVLRPGPTAATPALRWRATRRSRPTQVLNISMILKSGPLLDNLSITCAAPTTIWRPPPTTTLISIQPLLLQLLVPLLLSPTTTTLILITRSCHISNRSRWPPPYLTTIAFRRTCASILTPSRRFRRTIRKRPQRQRGATTSPTTPI